MKILKRKSQTKKCGGAFSGVGSSKGPYSFRTRKQAAAPAAASKQAAAPASKKAADYPNPNAMNNDLLRYITNIFVKIQDFENSDSPMDSPDFHSTLDHLVDWVLGISPRSPFTQSPVLRLDDINAIKNMIQLFVIRQIECERTNLTKGNSSLMKDYITIERDAVSDNRHRTQIIDFWQSDIGKDIMIKCFNTLPSATTPIPFTLSDKTVTTIIDHDDGKAWYAAHTVQAAWMLTGGTETKSSFEIDSDDFFLSLLGKCQKYGPGHAFPTSLIINKQHRNWTRPNSIGVWSGLGLYLVAYIKCIEMTFIEPKNSSGQLFRIPKFVEDEFYKKAKEIYLKEVMFNTIIEHIVEGRKENRKVPCLTKPPGKEGNATQKMLKVCQHLSIDSIVSIAINSLLNLLDPKLCRIITQKATLLLGSSAAENTRTRPLVPGCQGPSNFAAELFRRMIGNKTLETIFVELNEEDSITAKNIYTLDKLKEVKNELSDSIDEIIKEDEKIKDQEKNALEEANKALDASRAYEEEFTSELINDNEKLTEKYQKIEKKYIEIEERENALITELNHAVEQLQQQQNKALREQFKRKKKEERMTERRTEKSNRKNMQIRELEINGKDKNRMIKKLQEQVKKLEAQLEAAIQNKDFIKENEIKKKIKKIRDDSNIRTSMFYKMAAKPSNWNISERQRKRMRNNQNKTRRNKLESILKERRSLSP